MLRALDEGDADARFRSLRDLGPGLNGVGGLLRLFEMRDRMPAAGAHDRGDRRDRLLGLVDQDLIDRDEALDVLSAAAGAVAPIVRRHADRPGDLSARALECLATHLLVA